MEIFLDNWLGLGIHYRGVEATQLLQRELWPLKGHLVTITTLGDPFSAYTIIFPLLICLKKSMGRRVLWSACVAEWLNIILKWLLNGHRPYWWQFESAEWNADEVLSQVPQTCETGPGSPSGHCMISAAVWYLLADAAADAAAATLPKPLHWISWLVFWILLTLVAVSRVFIATHFPHQVVLGSAIGVLIAKAFLSKSFRRLADSKSAMRHIAVACGCVAIAFGSFFILSTLGLDPSTSVKLAMKHCASREWVHLNTTPYFSLVRMSGSIVGLGVARHFRLFSKKLRTLPLRLVLALVSIVCAHLVCAVPIVVSSPVLFNVLSFVRFVLLPISVALCGRLLSPLVP